MVTIRLEGAKELRAALESMSDDIREEVGKAVNGTALELRRDVVKAIRNGPATGRIYGKRMHQASAPGEAPANDTGRLLNSIFFAEGFGANRGKLAIVGSNVVYATYLEFGTRKIASRPFFRPAVERMRPKFQRRLERALRIATR